MSHTNIPQVPIDETEKIMDEWSISPDEMQLMTWVKGIQRPVVDFRGCRNCLEDKDIKKIVVMVSAVLQMRNACSKMIFVWNNLENNGNGMNLYEIRTAVEMAVDALKRSNGGETTYGMSNTEIEDYRLKYRNLKLKYDTFRKILANHSGKLNVYHKGIGVAINQLDEEKNVDAKITLQNTIQIATDMR